MRLKPTDTFRATAPGGFFETEGVLLLRGAGTRVDVNWPIPRFRASKDASIYFIAFSERKPLFAVSSRRNGQNRSFLLTTFHQLRETSFECYEGFTQFHKVSNE